MTHLKASFPVARFALGIVALPLVACSGATDDTGGMGTGTGSSSAASTTVGAGGSTAAATSTSTGVGGSSASGVTSSGSGGMTTGSGGMTTGTGNPGSGGTTTGSGGMTGSGQSPGSGGMTTGSGGMTTGSGGDETGSGGTGGTGSGGGAAGGDDLDSGPNTMGWIGCSMGENTAAGYRRIGGTRMWGGFGNGGAVVQQWTSNTSASWGRFDQQVEQYGEPVAVWIMICIFAQAGATAQEVNAMIENARSHSAPGVTIYLTGQPLYDPGHVCTLAGAMGPNQTDQLAQQVAAQHDDVIYPGALRLTGGEVSGDSCHANTQGEDSLGRQAKAFWGQP
jgi:hypothetical protein